MCKKYMETSIHICNNRLQSDRSAKHTKTHVYTSSIVNISFKKLKNHNARVSEFGMKKVQYHKIKQVKPDLTLIHGGFTI